MPTESLSFQPEPSRWPGLMRHNGSAQAREFRAQLGLPTDRPLIVSGHHTEFWHPGVVAKYLAADALAAKTRAGAVWLWVDQDRAESSVARFPVSDAAGALTERQVTLSRTTPSVHRAPRTPSHMREPEYVSAGLDRLGAAMSRHATAPDFAHQIAGAITDLLRPLLSLAPATVFAANLSRTSFFQNLVARMAQDPESCCRAYNSAVARHPLARVRPLVADEVQDRYELPLWHLPPGAPRRRVYAEDLSSIPVAELAPKALLMTGLFRLAGCDLFIHGLGAGQTGDDSHEGYDYVTAEWLAEWLAPPSIAPIAVITATRLLPLAAAPPPSPAAVNRAVWLAHSAPHNPHIIRDGYFDDAKRRLVLQIAATAHPGRPPLFRQMHALLDDYRRTHARDLDSIRADADAMRARLASAPIAQDRTWPFPLYPQDVLTNLRDDIRAAFDSTR